MEIILFLLPKELTYIIFSLLSFFFRASSVDYNTSAGEDLQTAELCNQIETNMCKAGKEEDEEEEEDWEDEDVDGEEDTQLRGQTLSDLIDSMAAEFNGECMYWTERQQTFGMNECDFIWERCFCICFELILADGSSEIF